MTEKTECFIIEWSDEDERGWWIVLLDNDRNAYDSAGPYKTKEEAIQIAESTNLKVIEK